MRFYKARFDSTLNLGTEERKKSDKLNYSIMTEQFSKGSKRWAAFAKEVAEALYLMSWM